MERLTMLGAPASGKGTQGVRVAGALGVPHVSVGYLLRASIDAGDPFGIQETLDSGELVPDEITERLVFPELGDGFVLDGYPRSLHQAQRLDEHLEEIGLPLDAAAELDVPDGTLAARLSLRAQEERRSDDTPEVFLHRLAAYHREAEKLREHYEGRLIRLDGVGSEEDVFERILAAIGR
ncbi:MAG: adenylate kinase family protein [Actinomycetota bacterium]